MATEIPPQSLARMLGDTVALRANFVRDILMLSAVDAAKLMSAFPSSLANDDLVESMAAQNLVFSLDLGDRKLFPAFQFSHTGPKPVVAKVLEIFTVKYTRWDIALWFAGANGWLGGKRPIDLLDDRPDLVRNAAEQFVLVD